MKNSRRQFMILSAAGACTLALNGRVQAQAMVSEADPQAKGLKYVAVSTTAGKNCGNCALYQGKAGSAAGGCPLFAGKQVAANGWCSAWAKKG
ncbi:high-potential iron-sulfur protein [Polynucleobacter antarcticus]|uniref:High-potential iron-sulfur protein n=1 Tax=Polynucleobacter antarcticus TaxID=1743162 RepID=A0A6M9PTZ6_9BURK|nr:high-potential iron-sulfur protein [Polynucleobacter antarcticus]QKM63322.1 twin-arginine translocation pathway signal protein [Polynucleobacter antarcticus]